MFAFLVKLAVMVVLAYLLRPKPPSGPRGGPKPVGLEDFDLPTAEEGRPIQVLFGKKRLKGPNVVWYGHLRSEAIWR